MYSLLMSRLLNRLKPMGTAEKMVFNVIIKYIEIMKYGKFEPLELFLSNKITMKNNERSLIIKLIKLFKEMYGIIVSNPNNDINYGKRTIKNIVQYLEAELTNDPLRYEELVSEVAKQYKSMFPPRGGLSEFYIWDDSYEVRYTSNHEYEQIKSQIEAILSKYM